MTDQENEPQRTQRLRELIDRLKSGRPIKRPDHAKSLKERIEERASRFHPPGRAKPG